MTITVSIWSTKGEGRVSREQKVEDDGDKKEHTPSAVQEIITARGTVMPISL